MIEGTWSGYNSGQRRVVHREFTTMRHRVEQIRNLGWILYTDGTTLSLTVTEIAGRQNLKPIAGYTSLIDKCIRHGVNAVNALPKE
jgi:hypothetical protein